MNEIKITAPILKALNEVAAGNVTYFYRSAPKIKGTRLVKAVSSEWLNKKIAHGVTDSMLAKLFDADLVATVYGRYGSYGVKLTATGANLVADAQGAMAAPLAPMTSSIADVMNADAKADLVGIVNEQMPEAPVAEVVAKVKGLIEIVNDLLAAAQNARTETAKAALYTAAGLVERGELNEARKVLVPLRTRASLVAIKAIKAL